MIVEMWGIAKVVNKQTSALFGETDFVSVPTEGPFETEAEAQKRAAELGSEYTVREVSVQCS
jgi:hypothetical protein